MSKRSNFMKILQKCLLSLSVVAAAVCCSCSTPKNITLFQDAGSGSVTQMAPQQEIKLRSGDVIQIIVSSKNDQLSRLFNKTVSYNSYGEQLRGYTLDNRGNVEYPILGSVHLAGLTRQEATEYIQSQLRDKNLANDAVVSIEFSKLTYSVLGAVGRPGEFNIDKDQCTIVEAIARAGDINLDGLRQNVRVFRYVNNTEHVYELDLTSAANTFESPAYYLQQGDIVYVEFNDKAKRTTTNNGNLFYQWGFWTSTISFLLSIGVIVLK